MVKRHAFWADTVCECASLSVRRELIDRLAAEVGDKEISSVIKAQTDWLKSSSEHALYSVAGELHDRMMLHCEEIA